MGHGVDPASTPDHLNQETAPMSTADSASQPTTSRDWGYSRAWRLVSVIILRPLLRLLMKHEWQGQENFPRTGGGILPPDQPSYAHWPTGGPVSGARAAPLPR